MTQEQVDKLKIRLVDLAKSLALALRNTNNLIEEIENGMDENKTK